jgi:hypothetical protein
MSLAGRVGKHYYRSRRITPSVEKWGLRTPPRYAALPLHAVTNFAHSSAAGDGALFFAGELAHYNGPWNNPDDTRKVNGMVRYSQGTADDGLTVTGMAYSNRWNSTDQVPQRTITSGLIDRWGEIDPSDGGNADRFSLSARLVHTDDGGRRVTCSQALPDVSPITETVNRILREKVGLEFSSWRNCCCRS